MISKRDRGLILRLLLETTEHMIKSSRFPEVTMHTFLPDLPPKALVKYRYIAQLFSTAGYRVKTEERRGQHIWWFRRRTTKASARRQGAGKRRR